MANFPAFAALDLTVVVATSGDARLSSEVP
jgi:hypothetical protein